MRNQYKILFEQYKRVQEDLDSIVDEFVERVKSLLTLEPEPEFSINDINFFIDLEQEINDAAIRNHFYYEFANIKKLNETPVVDAVYELSSNFNPQGTKTTFNAKDPFAFKQGNILSVGLYSTMFSYYFENADPHEQPYGREDSPRSKEEVLEAQMYFVKAEQHLINAMTIANDLIQSAESYEKSTDITGIDTSGLVEVRKPRVNWEQDSVTSDQDKALFFNTVKKYKKFLPAISKAELINFYNWFNNVKRKEIGFGPHSERNESSWGVFHQITWILAQDVCGIPEHEIPDEFDNVAEMMMEKLYDEYKAHFIFNKSTNITGVDTSGLVEGNK